MAKDDDPWAKFDITDAPVDAPADPWAKFNVPAGSGGVEPPAPYGAWQGVQDFARVAGNTASYGQLDRLRGLLDMSAEKPYGVATDEAVAKSTEARRRLGGFLSSTADVTGGIAPVVGLAKSGATFAANAAPQLWRRIAAGGVEGGLHGAAQGAGNTYTGEIGDYASNAGGGAVLGGAFGSAAPMVAKGVGSIYRAIADQGWRGSAPGSLAKAAQTDAAGLAALPGQGPAAMLVDAGPSMRGAGQGAVLGEPGPGKAALIHNLTARDAASPQRITGAVDQTFGPAPTPSHVERGVRERMTAMGPEYDAALEAAGRINTRGIDDQLLGEMGRTAGAGEATLRQIRQMLEIPTNPGVLDPNPVRIHDVRSAVRDIRDNPNADPAASAAAGRAYRLLTNELEANVPGYREINSRYAELGQQEAGVGPRSAGGRMFRTAQENVIRPVELQEAITEAAQPKGANIGPSAEPFRLRQAARAELDRIVGTNKNDLLALENALGRPQDWNAQKLAVMFGQERADQLMNVLRSERGFRESHQKIVEGSQTAQRLAAAKAQDAGSNVPTDTIGRPLWGDVKAIANWAKNKISDAGTNSTRDRIAQILATNDPQALRAIIPELLATQPTREAREGIIRSLVQQGITGGAAGWGGSPAVPKERRRQ